MALSFLRAGLVEESETIVNAIRKSFVPSSVSNEIQAIPYTANPGTNFETSLLWEHSDKVPAISPNAWYLFAEKGFDPFQSGGEKDIPQELKFWDVPQID